MTTRLFHVSDLHFGREDRAAIEWFAGRVHEEKPAAVIVTGDLTMRARSHEYAAAKAWLASLAVPLSIEPGNHDLPYYNPIARLVSPYKRHRRVEQALERPLDLPGVWLVPLKTTARAQWRLNWSRGVVRQRGLEDAMERLRACPPGHVAIVTCHHPLIGNVKTVAHGRTRGGEEALAALSAAGADAVLSGHVHDPFDDRLETAGGTVRLIGAGTLSQRVRSAPPSFNEIVVQAGRLDVRVRAMAAS